MSAMEFRSGHPAATPEAAARALADVGLGAQSPARYIDSVGKLLQPDDSRPNLRSSPGMLRELVASGRISEARMLDISARQLGVERVSLDLLPPEPELASLLDPRLCLRHSLVPWKRMEAGLVIATSRPENVPLMETIVPPGIGPIRVVLATTDEIQGHVAQTHRGRLTRRMAARPRLRDSFRSYKPTPAVRRTALAVSLSIATVAVLAPVLLFSFLLAWAALTLFCAVVLKSVAAMAQLRGERTPSAAPPPVALADLPTFSILVPLFREPSIADRLVHRLRQLDYPRGRLEVLLVLEETDELTAEVLARTELPPWMRIITVPDGKPRTKPRAMNYALDFCRGEFIGIYDAEDRPDPDQLQKVAAHFAAAGPDLGCVQGALDYYNPRQNWIARCFTIEYNTWFRLVLPGMARLGLSVPLGGTTLFLRRDAVEQVGAWDAHNVTEDADLGFRLGRYGWRTEVIETTTGEEANCRPIAWIRQRSRWLKGYMVTYIVQMRRPRRLLRDLGLRQFIGFQMHFVAAISQFLLAPLLWSFWLVLFGLPHPMTAALPAPVTAVILTLFLSSEVVTMTLSMVGTRRRVHRHTWLFVPTLIFYYPLACFAAYKAAYELLVAPFYWDKTTHGVEGSQAAAAQVPAPDMAPPSLDRRSAA